MAQIKNIGELTFAELYEVQKAVCYPWELAALDQMNLLIEEPVRATFIDTLDEYMTEAAEREGL